MAGWRIEIATGSRGGVEPGVPPVNQTPPTISGSTTVGGLLSCSPGMWTGVLAYSYQWQRNGVNIAGATNSSYLTVTADGNTNVRCVVTGTNPSGSASANSNALAIQALQPPVNTTAPRISGSTVVGSVLTSDNGAWSNNPTSYAYQWRRGGTAISGQTTSSYTTVSADIGQPITCLVTASNAAGAGTGAVSNAINVTAAPVYPPVNTALPVISGTPAVGQTLSCSNGTWNPAATSYAYQWKRGGANISGANSQTYLLVAADGGASITCTVTATNADGSASATSSPVNVPAQPPVNSVAPTISGSPEVGSVLTCSNGTWSGSPTYAYQWLSNGGDIGGATSQAYTTFETDIGNSISCRVTATNAGGSASQASSNAILVEDVSTGAWTPLNLPNLTCWYDAQDNATLTLNGSTVSQWNDKGPHGYHAAQGNATMQPTYNATGLNGLPGLYCTASGQSQQLPAPIPAQTFATEMFFSWAVHRQDNARAMLLNRMTATGTIAAPYTQWGGNAAVGNGVAQENVATTPISFNPHIYCLNIVANPKTINDWLDGAVGVSKPYTVAYSDAATSLYLCAGPGRPALGFLGEVVCCPSISASDRQKLEGYMAHRWALAGLLPAGHPYKAAPP